MKADVLQCNVWGKFLTLLCCSAVMVRGEGGRAGLEAALAMKEKTLSSTFIHERFAAKARGAKVNHLTFTQLSEGSQFQLSASRSHGADGS
jgi:hypothetical protein